MVTTNTNMPICHTKFSFHSWCKKTKLMRSSRYDNSFIPYSPLFFLSLPHIWPKFVVSMLYKLEDVPWLVTSRFKAKLWPAGARMDRMWRGPGIWREMTGDGWEMAVRSEEDNTNSILDTIYKSPPGLGVRQGGAVSHPNQHGPIVKTQFKASKPRGWN